MEKEETMLSAYTRFMRKRYSYVISGTLILAVAWGLFSSAPGLLLRRFSPGQLPSPGSETGRATSHDESGQR